VGNRGQPAGLEDIYSKNHRREKACSKKKKERNGVLQEGTGLTALPRKGIKVRTSLARKKRREIEQRMQEGGDRNRKTFMGEFL